MRRIALTTLLMLAPLAAQAQRTWRQLPNGNVGYNVTYSTVGNFFCDPYGVGVIGGTCTSSGNHLTLTSGSAILDLIYHPVTQQPITATTTFAPVPMGSFQTILSGTGPFSFPMTAHGFQPPLFAFFLSVLDENNVRQGGVAWGYISRGGTTLARNCCGQYDSEIAVPIRNSPAPFTYGELVFHDFSYPTIDAEDAMVDISATVAIIPEPESLLLIATGLGAGVAFGVRRRRIVKA